MRNIDHKLNIKSIVHFSFQRCAIFEAILRMSNFRQIQFLWTVIQPALHRDFMYTASKDYPKQHFIPISSHQSREIKVQTYIYGKSLPDDARPGLIFATPTFGQNFNRLQNVIVPLNMCL